MNNKGIALIQVLILLAILSVMALFFAKSAKQQVEFAHSFNYKSKAIVANHSAESLILYNLLTKSKGPNDLISKEELRFDDKWNFHSQSFRLDEFNEVKLQDLRGLLNLNYPEKDRVQRVLTNYGLSNYDAQLLYGKIVDYQDLDTINQYFDQEYAYKNGVIQHTAELNALIDDTELLGMLERNSTVFKTSKFNPMTSPNELLSLLFHGEIARAVISLRNSNALTDRKFSDLSGVMESESVILYPSNRFRVTIATKIENVRYVRTLYYLLNPSKASPVDLVSVEVKEI